MRQRTSRDRTPRSRAAIPLALAAILTATAGCSTEATTSEAPAEVPEVAVVKSAAALLPAEFKEQPTLQVAIPTNEPPTQFYAEGTETLTGVNPDIARLLGQALGLEVEIKVANFDSIIPGIAAGRYDMTVSSMTPTEDRMKVLDFVDYLNVGSAIAVPEGNPDDLAQDNLCGRDLAVLTGSYQLTTSVPVYDKDCVAAGEDTISISEYQDTRQAISALVSGRQDAVLADSPIVEYAAEQNPAIEVAERFGSSPVGIGLDKESGLLPAAAKAMEAILEDDAYVKVLEEYGLESSATDVARVNVPQ